jgi:hypothetical protein
VVDGFLGEGAAMACPDDEDAEGTGGFVKKEFNFI